MTRANPGQFYQLDSKLERNLRKSRRRLDQIDPDWPESCTMQVHLKVFPCVLFFFSLAILVLEKDFKKEMS